MPGAVLYASTSNAFGELDARSGYYRYYLTHAREALVMLRFPDRRAAGQELAKRVQSLGALHRPIVLALPRGGVPPGYEVAELLNAPLDVLVVRKLGVPFHEELAMGAIASGDMRVLDGDVLAEFGILAEEVEEVIRRERAELVRRERLYRGTRPYPDLRGSTVILVDDGLATGSTMRAALEAVRTRRPARVVVAAPVASHAAATMLMTIADACVFVRTPEPFNAVGFWYDDFSQTTDEEVVDLLSRARKVTALEVAS